MMDPADPRHALLDATPLPTFALMPDGHVLHWNAAATALLGVALTPGEEARGALRDAFSTLLRRTARGETHVQIHHLHAHPDGRHLNLLLTATTMDSEVSGRGMLGTAQLQGASTGAPAAAGSQLGLLQAMLDQANDSILITEAEPIDLPGPRIVYANAAFTRETGYTLDDVLGKTPRLLQGPDSDRQALDAIRAGLKAWERIQVEVLNSRKDGSEFWSELSIAPVTDETGWYTHWVSVQRDITDRKRFDAHLDRERAAILELSARNAPLDEILTRLLALLEGHLAGSTVTLQLTADSHRLYTSRGVEATPADVPAPTLRQEISGEHRVLGHLALILPYAPAPDVASTVNETVQRAALVIEHHEAHVALQLSNAALRAAVEHAELLASLGDSLQVQATPQDVATRAAEMLTPVVQAEAMLVMLVDGDGVELLAATGSLPESVSATLHDTAWFSGLFGAASTSPSAPPPATYQDDAGAQLPGMDGSSYGIEPITTAQGRVIGVVSAWRGPSAGAWQDGQRELLRRAAATVGLALERALAGTEAARQQRELEEVNAVLRRSNAELERFAYVASHDLQAPIRAVTSFAELLSARHSASLDARASTYLQHIVTSGRHMKRLVDDLLRYSRITAQRPDATSVSLGTVMADVTRLLQPELDGFGGQVRWNDLPVVLGDPQLLHQLLQNLVGNGLKYRRPGVPPRVTVRGARDGNGWRIDVQDNGIGIEAEHQQRIFEVFQRLHAQDEYEGTGIGLAICRRIAEQLGGQLWVESTPGVGSTFTFQLPS